MEAIFYIKMENSMILLQVAMAIRRASGNSLVIIDEFGKGTMTVNNI